MRNNARLPAGIAGTMLFFLLGWLAATTPVAASPYVVTSDGGTPVPVVAVDNVCAWPNLTMLDGGTIAATIFNQPHHGRDVGDVEVWTSINQGESWQYAGTPAVHDPDTVRMNHAAGKAQNGDLLVIASGYGDPGTWGDMLDPWLCRSSNGGVDWTVDKTAIPNRSPDGSPVVPFGDIIEGDDGVLRAAVYSWPGYYPRGEHSLVISSQDDGLSWDNGFVPLDNGVLLNETALLNTGGNNWIAAARTEDDASLALYASIDNGQTWQPGGKITSGHQHPGHFLRMQDGRILLTYGNRTVVGDRGVEVLVSDDEGATWSDPLRVMDYTGDGGYPSSVQLPDGQILTAYYAEEIAGHDRYHMGVVTWDPARSFPIPEPSTIVLLAIGGLALVVIRRRRLGFHH